jgi:4-hydroxy-tetrahydrodipicolinate synthase
MVQMVEAAEQNDFATARRWHQKLLPIMQVNFVESSPGPVKFAMAAMGLCEEVFRLPMVSPRQASKEKVLAVLKDLGMPVVAGAHA